MYRCLSR